MEIEKRASKKGTRYRVRINLKGHPTVSQTFDRLSDAKTWGQDIETQIKQGRYFKNAEAKKRLLAEAIDKYIQVQIPRKGNWAKDQIAQLKKWKEELGDYTVADITPAMIVEVRDKLEHEPFKAHGWNNEKTRSPATINRYLAALSHVFTTIIDDWHWLTENPVAKVKRLEEPHERLVFLTDEELEKLVNACRDSKNEMLLLIVTIAVANGPRRNELATIKTKLQINFDMSTIILFTTKNKTPKVLHVSNFIMAMLKKHCDKYEQLYPDSPYAFPSKQDPNNKPIDFRSAWRVAVKRAGIKRENINFRFHDLRHCAGSYLAMNGATDREIAEILGHKEPRMVKRYAHLSHTHTAKVVEAMNEKMLKNLITVL